MRNIVFVTSILMLCLAIFPGCAVMEKLEGSDIQNNFWAAFLTQYATLSLVEDDDKGIDIEKAQRAYQYASDVMIYLESGIEISIDELERYVVNKIDWRKLSAADTIAVRNFVKLLSNELKKRVEKYEAENGPVVNKTIVAKQLVQIVLDTLGPYQS